MPVAETDWTSGRSGVRTPCVQEKTDLNRVDDDSSLKRAESHEKSQSLACRRKTDLDRVDDDSSLKRAESH
eukprot:2371377-Pleurochrysis_carterae.AAC.1